MKQKGGLFLAPYIHFITFSSFLKMIYGTLTFTIIRDCVNAWIHSKEVDLQDGFIQHGKHAILSA